MIRKCILIVSVILLSGCGVTMKSVVDNELVHTPYTNILMVITYQSGVTKTFVTKLKQRLEAKLNAQNKQVKTLLPTQKTKSLQLNQESFMDKLVNDQFSEGYDLLLRFHPTHLVFQDGGLQSITYEIVAIDVQTKKEIWKATFSSASTLGPTLFAEKSARKIHDQLIADRVL